MNMNMELKQQLDYGQRMVEQVKTIFRSFDPNVVIEDCQYTEDDFKHATDIKVTLNGKTRTVGVRVRNNNYKSYRTEYPNDFTIRSFTSEGQTTELNKVVNGYMDLMFYCHEYTGSIVQWSLLNMDVWRWDVFQSGSMYFESGRNIPNYDERGTSFFAYNINKFRKELVICRG